MSGLDTGSGLQHPLRMAQQALISALMCNVQVDVDFSKDRFQGAEHVSWEPSYAV